jgi:hypothetical protein
MGIQLEIATEVAAVPPMPEHIARRVMEMYGALSTRRIAERHRALMSYLPATCANHIDTINDARDALMRAACRKRYR